MTENFPLPFRIASPLGDFGIENYFRAMRIHDAKSKMPEPTAKEVAAAAAAAFKLPEVGDSVAAWINRDGREGWFARRVEATDEDEHGPFFRVRTHDGKMSGPLYATDRGTLWR